MLRLRCVHVADTLLRIFKSRMVTTMVTTTATVMAMAVYGFPLLLRCVCDANYDCSLSFSSVGHGSGSLPVWGVFFLTSSTFRLRVACAASLLLVCIIRRFPGSHLTCFRKAPDSLLRRCSLVT